MYTQAFSEPAVFKINVSLNLPKKQRKNNENETQGQVILVGI